MRQIMVVIATLVLAGTASAQEPPADAGPSADPDASDVAAAPTDGPLKVVVAGSEPFVIPPGSGESLPTGLSIDVWRAVAAELGREFEYVMADSVAGALAMVEGGDADVAVGPISITDARAERVAFTQPYFESSLSILARGSQSALDRLEPFLTTAFLTGASALVLVLLLVGTLGWLAERRVNHEHFPRDQPIRGIGNGLWMALVTMTTVGYGDRVPETIAGRVIMGVWMIISMITASSIIAFMATALTLSQLDEPAIATAEELNGRRVAVVPGTTGLRFVQRQRARPVESEDLPAAIERVRNGEAAAVVYDRPMLRHYLNQNPDVDLVLSAAAYEPQGYGFAIRHGSSLEQPMDVAILRMQRRGKGDALAEQWLGP